MANEFIFPPERTEQNRFVTQLIDAWIGNAGLGVPLRLTNVNDATKWAVDLQNAGTGGQGLRVKNSGGTVTLLTVDNTGVKLSPDGVVNATNPFVYPNMVVGWLGTAASVPSGYAVIAGAKGRFGFGATVDGDVGTTGGASTVNLAHTHTSAGHSHSHNHTSAAHQHVHHHDMNHEHNHDHWHDLSDHRHEFAHEHSFVHDHGGETDTPINPTAFDVQDTTETVAISHPDHTHGIFDESVSTTTTGGTEDGGSNNFTISPTNSRDGFSGPPVDGTGTLSHARTSLDFTDNQDGTTLTTTDWDLILLNGASGTNTDDVGGNTTPANTGTDATSTTPADTGSSLSSSQSIVPQYYAWYWIQRS